MDVPQGVVCGGHSHLARSMVDRCALDWTSQSEEPADQALPALMRSFRNGSGLKSIQVMIYSNMSYKKRQQESKKNIAHTLTTIILVRIIMHYLIGGHCNTWIETYLVYLLDVHGRIIIITTIFMNYMILASFRSSP